MTLGIIGGGQLGMFLCQSAKKRNIKTIVLDPDRDCPCRNYAYELIVTDYNDEKGIVNLFSKSDYVTYEFENISSTILDLVDTYKLIPKENSLIFSKNRILEKTLAKACGLNVPKYSYINNPKVLKEYTDFPYILKSNTGGYDGKNQFKINCHEDYELVPNDIEYILEEKIDFDFEFSIIGFRNRSNKYYFYPPFINEHRNGILHHSKIGDFDFDYDIFKRFMEKLDLIGILCIEFFYKDGEIYFNEMAPRPHNSGHLTLDAFKFSQFDMAISAILDETFPENKLIENTEMFNVLGQHYDLSKGMSNFYDYGKKECRENRKMGHINVNDNNSLKVEGLFNE